LKATAIRRFRRLCLTTLVAVFFLIGVGGVVRTTGSGMGCPDWPKCFGQWIPPTSVQQLPENYKEVYSNHREEKNKKFARYLHLVGLHSTAQAIVGNPAILEESTFNAAKTWIEYLNRLVGVIIGLLIVAVFFASWKFLRYRKRLPIVASLTLVLVIVQGWFGSIVVSTNLTTWTITIHMLLALVIVAMLVYLFEQTGEARPERTMNATAWLVTVCLALLLMQIIFGTKVREHIDVIAQSGLDRSGWIATLGSSFLIHRSFSWIVLATYLLLLWQLRKTTDVKTLSRSVIILILATLLSGVAMAYGGVPAFMQPIHLLIATVTFGLLFMLLMRMTVKRNVSET